MSDCEYGNSFGGGGFNNDDLTLPKATVAKIVSEILSQRSGTKDTQPSSNPLNELSTTATPGNQSANTTHYTEDDDEFDDDDDDDSQIQPATPTNQSIGNPRLSTTTGSSTHSSSSGPLVFARETRDLLILCCVEFISLVASEANEVAEREAKKTIACEHVAAALEQLGYADYVPEVEKVARTFKRLHISREKKQSKIEQSGLTEDELIRQQQELFRSATDKFNALPSSTPGPSS